MEFGLTDEQLILQDTARRFAKTEIAPIAAQYDQSGEFPRELIKRAWELGLSSTCIPEEFGGVGLSVFESCLATEELSWGCSGIATSIMCNDLGLTPILAAGSQDQKREWLGACASEFKMVSFCLSESEAGSDVAGLQLRAEKDGDDYLLNGTKCWITNGGWQTSTRSSPPSTGPPATRASPPSSCRAICRVSRLARKRTRWASAPVTRA